MTPPPSWPRPHFAPGGGGPFVLFAVFGRFDLSVPLGPGYRTAGLPPGFDLRHYDRHAHPADFAHFFGPAAWRVTAAANPELAAAAEAAGELAVVRGTAADPPTLDYLRDAIGVVTYLLDRGGTCVLDPQTLHLWPPADWRARVFGPQPFVPHALTAILRSDEPGHAETVQTRGMLAFGRPDLVVRGVGLRVRKKVVELLNLYVEYQALGGVIEAGDVVTLDGLPPGGECGPMTPAAHNRVVEIRWPPGALAGWAT